MTDHYLVSELSKRDPRLQSLYDHTSGYIHLSNRHFHNAMLAGEDREVTTKITDRDEFIAPEIYLEAIVAFNNVTELLLQYAYGWAYTKEHAPVMKPDSPPQ